MKKVIYALTIFFVFSIISDVAFAKTETEYDKAVRYYNTGKYREAVEIFKDYIKTEPEAPAYYRIGYALYKLGEYAEANQYFQQAYLIDPSFSPDIVAPKIKAKKIAKQPIEKATPMKEPELPISTEIQPETPPAPVPVPGPKPQMQMEPHRPQEQVAAPGQQPLPGKTGAIVPAGKEAPSTEQQVVTPQRVQPPTGFPEFPKPPAGIPADIPGLGTGMMAGLGMIMTAIQIGFLLMYIFFSFCLFLIAKKLNIPAPWLAFIPIVQYWTMVSCAGKPWWWVLIIFIVPLVNLILYFYVWMLIAENLGKSKFFGFLAALPLIGLIFIAMLAFSKSEGIGTAEGITTV